MLAIRRGSDVFRPFEEIQREMDRLFNEAFRGLNDQSKEAGMFSPEVDIYEKDNSVFIEMDIPGIKKDELEIKVEDDVLSIKGEKKLEREEKERDYHRYERYSGAFQRIFRLPEYVKSDDVKAKYEDGVLKLELPKKERSQERSYPSKDRLTLEKN
ncbi:Hsp20/alpha crystallin family protein [Mesotoga sp. Brook.08.YT.4.2.5.1]|uniref:Hsp20/alpha crystallin family protein n=1 Tax=Mesotoga sp. Brook.08.YT.4.2.5.1 TaxID=1421001 RepID=UPI000C9C7CBA|nr:Hsp20/alpha crystallin family protein [Mesotoga sp. Brook.08.YT.4.2.5.1]